MAIRGYSIVFLICIYLYICKCLGLDGKPAKSDPYLKVTLGDFVFNDRKNAVNDVTDVDFYKLIELDAELPGNQIRAFVSNITLISPSLSRRYRYLSACN